MPKAIPARETKHVASLCPILGRIQEGGVAMHDETQVLRRDTANYEEHVLVLMESSGQSIGTSHLSHCWTRQHLLPLGHLNAGVWPGLAT